MTRRWRRASVLAVAGAAATPLFGCLEDAPEYPERGQIPPFVLTAQVTPPVSEIYESGTPLNINVPFRSEDVNEELIPRFYVDFVPGDVAPQFEGSVQPIPPSTFDDDTRSVTWQWNNERDYRGCHSLTLILTYASNLGPRDLPIDESRTARVVWWLNLEDPQGTVLMRSCPRSN